MDTTTQLTDYSDDSLFNNDAKLTEIPYIGKNLELIDQSSSNCDIIIKWASRIELESITMKEAIDKVMETTSKNLNKPDISIEVGKSISKVAKSIDFLKSMIDGIKSQHSTTFATSYTILQDIRSNIKFIKETIDIQNKTQIECTKAIGSLFNVFQHEEKLRASQHLVIRDEIGEVKHYLSLLLPLVDKIQKSSQHQVPEVAQEQRKQPELVQPTSTAKLDSPPALTKCNQERVNPKSGARPHLRSSWVWTWFVQDPTNSDLACCDYCNEVVETVLNNRPGKLAYHLKAHNLTKHSINHSRQIPSHGFGMMHPNKEKRYVHSTSKGTRQHAASHQNSSLIVSQCAPPSEHNSCVTEMSEDVVLKRNMLMQEKNSGTNPAIQSNTGLRLPLLATKSKKRRIF